MQTPTQIELFGQPLELNDRHACCLITVDAYRQTIPFYQRMGFEFLSDNDKEDNTRLMFLDLADLEEYTNNR